MIILVKGGPSSPPSLLTLSATDSCLHSELSAVLVDPPSSNLHWFGQSGMRQPFSMGGGSSYRPNPLLHWTPLETFFCPLASTWVLDQILSLFRNPNGLILGRPEPHCHWCCCGLSCLIFFHVSVIAAVSGATFCPSAAVPVFCLSCLSGQSRFQLTMESRTSPHHQAFTLSPFLFGVSCVHRGGFSGLAAVWGTLSCPQCF